MNVRQIPRAWNANRPWLLLVIAYGVLAILYGLANEGTGPLNPSGHLDVPVILFALALLALRLAVLFVVPAVLVYRLVRWGSGR
jgi:hypothetical protein